MELLFVGSSTLRGFILFVRSVVIIRYTFETQPYVPLKILTGTLLTKRMRWHTSIVLWIIVCCHLNPSDAWSKTGNEFKCCAVWLFSPLPPHQYGVTTSCSAYHVPISFNVALWPSKPVPPSEDE